MKTTIRKLYKYGPCSDGFAQLIYSVTGRKEPPEMNISEQLSLLTKEERGREIDLIEILEFNGIGNAVWALRCFDYKDYCLFLADVAESVLPVFEAEYPADDRPRKAIKAIRDYHVGKITEEELAAAARAARIAAKAAGAVKAATKAAERAAWTAVEATKAGRIAGSAAATTEAAAGAALWAENAAAQDTKWREIESLFRKHFGGVKDENNP